MNRTRVYSSEDLVKICLKKSQGQTDKIYNLLFQVQFDFLTSNDQSRDDIKGMIAFAEDAAKEYRDALEKGIREIPLSKLLHFEEEYLTEMVHIVIDLADLEEIDPSELEEDEQTQLVKKFWELLGIYLYINKELMHRVVEANRVGDDKYPFSTGLSKNARLFDRLRVNRYKHNVQTI